MSRRRQTKSAASGCGILLSAPTREWGAAAEFLCRTRHTLTTAPHTTGRPSDECPTARSEHARPDTRLALCLVVRFAALNARHSSFFRLGTHGTGRCAHLNLNSAPLRVPKSVSISEYRCRPDLSFWILIDIGISNKLRCAEPCSDEKKF